MSSGRICDFATALEIFATSADGYVVKDIPA